MLSLTKDLETFRLIFSQIIFEQLLCHEAAITLDSEDNRDVWTVITLAITYVCII